MGEQLNAAAENWRRGVYDTNPGAKIREAMHRPTASAIAFSVGKYVAIAMQGAFVIGLFVAEFNPHSQALSITNRDIPPSLPDDLPEPFATLASEEARGVVAVTVTGGTR